MVLLGGLGGGVGLALLLDRFDPRVQYVSEVAAALRLEILGVIPIIAPEGTGSKKENRQAVEAFRHLRLNLEFAYGTGKPLAFTLTSPSPSEGKSTLVANLASTFADVGRRILVIDGDTRRGDVHAL
jgi:Mrp family chromosome partitioning ATPase